MYTDYPAVGVQEEIAKLPWLTDALLDAPDAPKTRAFDRFQKVLGELVKLAQVFCVEGESSDLEVFAGVKEMAADSGWRSEEIEASRSPELVFCSSEAPDGC